MVNTSLSPIKTFFTLLCISLMAILSFEVKAAVQITLDKLTMEIGEQIQMVISSDAEGDLDPNSLTALQQVFQIHGNSHQQQLQFINGKKSVNNSWILIISASQLGTHKLPGIKVGKQTSQPFQVTVTPIQTTQPKNGAPADFLLLGTVDNLTPYVKSEVIYSLKLLYTHPILSGQVSHLRISNLPIKTITKDKRYTSIHKGKKYNIIEWRFALIPQLSGDLNINQLTFQGTVTPPQGRKNIRLATDLIKLKIKPQANAWNQINAEWLPAKNLNIWEKWQPSVNEWETGKRYRREIQLDAEGIEAKQLAALNIKLNQPNLSIYPQKPTRNDQLNEQGHKGKYTHQIDYVPNKAGIATIPEIKIPWWDTKKNQLRYAILPARTVQILNNKNPNQTSNNSSNSIATILNTPTNSDPINQQTNPIEINPVNPDANPVLQKQTETSILNLLLANKVLLIFSILSYSLLMILLGLWVGKKGKQTSHIPQKTPASLQEALSQLQNAIKNRNTKKAHIIYQMMLRCYTKYQRELTLELNSQWLKQIKQLQNITNNPQQNTKINFKSLENLLQKSAQQNKKKIPSDLPSLYPQ
jgi:hypothetical protein